MSQRGQEGEDIIGRWSEDKLELLAKYLDAYSVIMNNQKTPKNPRKKPWLKAYYYIDAFAGSVRPTAKEDEQRYIEGSPLRALRTEPPFDGYWFIDASPQRTERLERLCEEFTDREIQVLRGNCNEILCNNILPNLSLDKKSPRRAFVFLDPYGLQVDWETIVKLAKTEACDIFINFSVMGVTRLLPKEQEPKTEVVEQLNKVMGSIDWLEKIYQPPKNTQLTLFDDPGNNASRDKISANRLADLYTGRLKTLFPYVSNPVIMKNSKNAALYALCLASHNKTAIKITNDIFKLYEKLKLQG
jgi:three-Cys-motif partner protein